MQLPQLYYPILLRHHNADNIKPSKSFYLTYEVLIYFCIYTYDAVCYAHCLNILRKRKSCL